MEKSIDLSISIFYTDDSNRELGGRNSGVIENRGTFGQVESFTSYDLQIDEKRTASCQSSQ